MLESRPTLQPTIFWVYSFIGCVLFCFFFLLETLAINILNYENEHTLTPYNAHTQQMTNDKSLMIIIIIMPIITSKFFSLSLCLSIYLTEDKRVIDGRS